MGRPRITIVCACAPGAPPTYTRILENIHTFLADFPETHLTLRINVAQDNVCHLGELLESIPAPFWARVQVNVKPIEGYAAEPTQELYKRINQIYRQELEWVTATMIYQSRPVDTPTAMLISIIISKLALAPSCINAAHLERRKYTWAY